MGRSTCAPAWNATTASRPFVVTKICAPALWPAGRPSKTSIPHFGRRRRVAYCSAGREERGRAKTNAVRGAGPARPGSDGGSRAFIVAPAPVPPWFFQEHSLLPWDSLAPQRLRSGPTQGRPERRERGRPGARTVEVGTRRPRCSTRRLAAETCRAEQGAAAWPLGGGGVVQEDPELLCSDEKPFATRGWAADPNSHACARRGHWFRRPTRGPVWCWSWSRNDVDRGITHPPIALAVSLRQGLP